MDNVNLHFDDSSLRLIAKKTLKRKSGARGIRTIVEKILLDTMYTIPSKTWKDVFVKTKDDYFIVEKKNDTMQEVSEVWKKQK